MGDVVDLDAKDLQILEALKQNGRASTQAISKKTRIPITTVHHRMKKMEESGVIKGYTVVIDNKKLGRPFSAYILITVDYRLLKEKKTTQYDIVKKLKQSDSVEEASMLTGGADIIIRVRSKDIDELNEFVTIYLRNIDGIEKTQTAIVLNEA